MESDNTNVQSASDEQSVTDDGTEGAETQTAQTEARFTQADMDRAIKSRLAEKERTLKTKHEKEIEDRITAVREEAMKDLEKLVEEKVNVRLAEQELSKARSSLQAEYGLNEEQTARLQGATPEELSKDAEKIYGAFRQLPKPPIIKTGETTPQSSPTDLSQMSPAEIRKNADKLWKQHVRH